MCYIDFIFLKVVYWMEEVKIIKLFIDGMK